MKASSPRQYAQSSDPQHTRYSTGHRGVSILDLPRYSVWQPMHAHGTFWISVWVMMAYRGTRCGPPWQYRGTRYDQKLPAKLNAEQNWHIIGHNRLNLTGKGVCGKEPLSKKFDIDSDMV